MSTSLKLNELTNNYLVPLSALALVVGLSILACRKLSDVVRVWLYWKRGCKYCCKWNVGDVSI